MSTGKLRELTMSELIKFAQIRDRVESVYKLYREHVVREAFDDGVQQFSKIKIPETFKFVTALSHFFYPELKVVAGHVGFASRSAQQKETYTNSLYMHYWLIWRGNGDHIIDVVPSDGFFVISTPQIVVQYGAKRRFIPFDTLYPKNWKQKEIQAFNKDVSSIIDTLEMLTKNTPLAM